jgi:peptide/nickel transport system permease protein
MASWGSMLAIAEEYIDSGGWWLSAGPGLAIFLTVVAFNIVGDRFRDAVDPRSE